MKVRFSVAVFALLLGLPLAAGAATPAPSSGNEAPLPKITLPTTALHTEFLVKVNKKGQVVSSKPAKLSKADTFNVQTFGNSMQMWIRKEDGSATVGLFRVTYDYDPKTHKVHREIALVSAGGDWGDKEGAANVMFDTAEKQAEEAQKLRKEQSESLPSLNQITGKSPTPSPAPLRSPH